MLISASVAQQVVGEWWSQYRGDFPYPCVVSPVRVDPDLKGRRVDVRLRSDTSYSVVKLFVDNDKTVAVYSDRREKVLRMAAVSPVLSAVPDQEAEHERSVSEVMSALQRVRERYPQWFVSVTTPDLCARGNASDVAITLIGKKSRQASVDIKVLQSKTAKANFNRLLTDIKRLRMITLIVRNGQPRGNLYDEIVCRLREIRRQAKLD
jgi:hypothetical protein